LGAISNVELSVSVEPDGRYQLGYGETINGLVGGIGSHDKLRPSGEGYVLIARRPDGSEVAQMDARSDGNKLKLWVRTAVPVVLHFYGVVPSEVRQDKRIIEDERVTKLPIGPGTTTIDAKYPDDMKLVWFSEYY
jgi:hypothetical protein